jgi:hypothetical protein
MIEWLSTTKEGQSILVEALQKIPFDETRKVSTKLRETVLTIAKRCNKTPPPKHPLLRHLMGLDLALITPRQWKQYQSQQEEKFGVGPEKGRRSSCSLNKYIKEVLKIEFISDQNRVAFKDPRQVLGLLLAAVKAEFPEIDFSEYKMIIRVSLDGRKLKPFNVALTWTLLGFSKLNKPPGGRFIDFDTRKVFPTQHWTSAIAMSMFSGKENFEDIQNNCTEVVICCGL